MADEGNIPKLLFLFILGGLLHYTDSTTCGPLTGSTCVENDLSLGICSEESTCACITGYIPFQYGCQADPLADSVVELTFNGEVQLGSNFYLVCKGPDGWSSSWSKNGVNIPGETSWSLSYDSATLADSGSYRCMKHKGTLKTGISEPKVVTVGELTIKPIVTGISQKVAMGMKVLHSCQNYPKRDSSVCVWKLDGETIYTGSTQYSMTYADGMQGKQLTCEYGIASDPVTLPDQFSDTITGVEVVGRDHYAPGASFELTCVLTDGYPVEDTSGLTTYSWYKDGIQLEAQSFPMIYLSAVTREQSGPYQCAADFSGTGQKMSLPFIVSIDNWIGDIKCIKSGTQLLKNGYLSMTVEYKTKNKAIRISSYEWRVDGVSIPGFDSPLLEINSPGNNLLDGEYLVILKTNFEGLTFAESCGSITAAESSEIESSQPRLYERDGATSFLFDVEYTFVCESDYHTPGGVYTWYKDNVDMSNDAKEFPYKATHDDVIIKCEYEFDGSKSPAAEISVKGNYIANVIVSSAEGRWLVETLSVGEEFMDLSCIATVSPFVSAKVEYSWNHNSLDSESRISTCTATVLTESKSTTVTARKNIPVPATPMVTSREQDGSDDITNEDDVIAVLGEEVTLYCQSKSYQSSKSSFRWKKNDVLMESETGFSKRISSMKKEDEGQYTCQIIVDGKESEYAVVPKVVIFSDAPPCTWTTDCQLPNYNDTICLDGKCKCLDGYQQQGRQCVIPPPPSCDRGWRLTAQKDTCVRVIQKPKSFSHARGYCMKTLNGDLITRVTSRRERSFVTRQVKSRTQFWIGVHSPDKNGVYQYVNQKPLVGKGPFKRGRPKGTSKNYCVAMKKRVWLDKNCRRRLPFACEKAANNI